MILNTNWDPLKALKRCSTIPGMAATWDVQETSSWAGTRREQNWVGTCPIDLEWCVYIYVCMYRYTHMGVCWPNDMMDTRPTVGTAPVVPGQGSFFAHGAFPHGAVQANGWAASKTWCTKDSPWHSKQYGNYQRATIYFTYWYMLL